MPQTTHIQPRRTFVTPVVTELAAVLEPVGRDTFNDCPDDVVRCRSWRPERASVARSRRSHTDRISGRRRT
jgi:hypothetical protein